VEVWDDQLMNSPALEGARAGDEQAFEEFIAPHLRELHLHCYRMLGSADDADDLLQETLTAAWRGLPAFAGRSSPRSWLYRIATNRCLNAIRQSKRRPPTEPVPPFDPPEPSRRGDVTWLQPYPDSWLEQLPDTALSPGARLELRESVELAFISALQRLPPRQTAALILCDVLGFATAEAAGILDTTPIALKGALQRARASIEQRRPAAGVRPTPGSDSERELSRRFADAFTEGNLEGVIRLLTDDAWLAMPPASHEYLGSQAIAAFLQVSNDWRRGTPYGLVPTRANTQPAFGCYIYEIGTGTAIPQGIVVLTLAQEGIRTITRFLDGALNARFGTPGGLARGFLGNR
jgi:RNA polymerase sigma-70 factor (TIGR02960 family)